MRNVGKIDEVRKWIFKDGFYEIHQMGLQHDMSEFFAKPNHTEHNGTFDYDAFGKLLEKKGLSLSGGSMYLFTGSAKNVNIIHCFGRDGNQTIITDNTAYILNENGKTIQSIYA